MYRSHVCVISENGTERAPVFLPLELVSMVSSAFPKLPDLILYALGCPTHSTTGEDGWTTGAQKRSKSVCRSSGANRIAATDTAIPIPPTAIHNHRRLLASGVATAGTV